MAKLTLSFKGRLLSIHHLDDRPMTVGRDPDCRICIDSLAIAPRHAELIPTDTGVLLLALDPEYPVLLNNEKVDQASLHHGDLIQIGKHTLDFSENSLELSPLPAAPGHEPEEPPGASGAGILVPAYMQVQSGPNIGRVIVFRRAVTRLGRIGAEEVIVTRSDDTYHLSRLEGAEPIRIAGVLLEGDAQLVLHDNDLVQIGDTRLRFFSGAGNAPARAAASIQTG